MAWTDLISLVILSQVCYVTFKLYTRMERPVPPRPNILVIMVDGLRTDIGPYANNDRNAGDQVVYTPNIDALAASSLTFKNAYAQYSTGTGSRASMLTGRYPDTTRIYDSYKAPNQARSFTTLPQYFKEQGFLTAGMGRVFGGDEDFFTGDAWSYPFYIPETDGYWNSKNDSWRAVSEEERARPLPDELTTLRAIEALQKLGGDDDDTPFFVVVGYQKPSMPFVFPEEYLSYYPQDSVYLLDDASRFVPQNMPGVAWSGNTEFRQYEDVSFLSGRVNSTVEKGDMVDLRRAYYASVSYIDAQIGRVLESLQEYPASSETITVLVGTTGYLLGEHAEWCTDVNMDLPSRVPLIVHDPRDIRTAGQTTDQFLELVSLFQTLVDFAGADILPGCAITPGNRTACVEGQSLARFFKDGSRAISNKAFTQTLRPANTDDFSIMGYSVRTKRYRYTEWVKFDDVETFTADWDVVFGYELYDHEEDPNENINVINDIRYTEVKQQLRGILRDHNAVPA